MTQLSKLTFKLFLTSIGAAYLVSCTGGAVSSSFGGAGGGGSAFEAPPGQSNGIADPSMFYVGVDSDINDIAHVHQQGQFNSFCSIDPKTSLKDITCLIEVPEAELFMHGLSLKYNVPSGMCRYLRRTPYWFYNHEVGYGVTSIVVNQTFTDGVLTAASCSINGGATSLAECNSNLEVNVDPEKAVATCIYDHSTSGGVNGCLGSYSMTVNTTQIVTTPPSNGSTTNVIRGMWGENVSALIGGAARWGWSLSSSGYPLTLRTPAHLGLLNNTYTVPAPVDSIGTATTIDIANFSTSSLNIHDGFVSGTQSPLPYAIAPIDDLSGSTITPGNDSYLFECRDQADELLHRVKVYVREWDTYQDYIDYVESKGTTEVPDRRGGEEGTSCIGLAGRCNDYADWDDIADAFGGYSTNLPGDINRRRSYFPAIPNK